MCRPAPWASDHAEALAEMFACGGRLIAIPLVEPEAEHQVGLIAARRDPQTPVLSALIEMHSGWAAARSDRSIGKSYQTTAYPN
jgi:hypothetical protein